VEGREIKPANPDWKTSDLPPQWRLWLSNKRETPPTDEEILKDEQQAELMRKKIKEVEEKESRLQAHQKIMDSRKRRGMESGNLSQHPEEPTNIEIWTPEDTSPTPIDKKNEVPK